MERVLILKPDDPEQMQAGLCPPCCSRPKGAKMATGRSFGALKIAWGLPLICRDDG